LHRNREKLVGVVGSHGQLTQSAILRNPRTKYKRSNIVFSVTSIALSCARVCFFSPQMAPHFGLLQPLAQSLIWSPSTLGWGISGTNVDSQWNPVYNVFH